MKNERQERQQTARNIAKATNTESIVSFEQGVKWADFHPDWKEGKPQQETNQYGLPKLYLVQVLSLDMAYGYRYTYRVAFINDKGEWNVDSNSMFKVVRYLDIHCDESDSQMIQKDIPYFNQDSTEEENEENDNKAA